MYIEDMCKTCGCRPCTCEVLGEDLGPLTVDWSYPEPEKKIENNNKKYDQGKIMVGLMKKDFSRALKYVAEITTYGVKKYNQPGSWRHVEDGLNRYEDALGRHDLEMSNDRYSKDEESGLLHAGHRAWNALATLEKILEDMDANKES